MPSILPPDPPHCQPPLPQTIWSAANCYVIVASGQTILYLLNLMMRFSLSFLSGSLSIYVCPPFPSQGPFKTELLFYSVSDKQTKRTWTTLLGDFGRSRVSCENVWNVWAVKLLAISQLSFFSASPALHLRHCLVIDCTRSTLQTHSHQELTFTAPDNDPFNAFSNGNKVSTTIPVAPVLNRVSSSWAWYISRINKWPVRWCWWWLDRLSRIYIFDLIKIQL